MDGLRSSLLALGVLVASARLAGTDPSVRFFDAGRPEDLAERLIAAMRPEERLGQVFFVGYQGKELSEPVRRWIVERHVGGIKLFPRNVSTLANLARDVRSMQELALSGRFAVPLLIATDQEGGWVQHIRAGAPDSPGNMALAAAGLPGDAYRTGYYVARGLRALGINMNFAPTVDVYSHPADTVIGPRAFSSDPIETALFAVAYFRGMEAAGVIATAKHFPGHGAADRDSHGSLPVVPVSWETLWERDLVPYRLLVREGLPAVMSGHVAFPAIEGRVLPSTLSEFFLREVLRRRLGFQGVIVTDDLEMNGALQGGRGIVETCRLALEAGADMLLLSHTPRLQDEVWEALSALYARDGRFRRTVDEAARRVLLLKLRHLKGSFPLLPRAEGVRRVLGDEESFGFFLSSATRAVTVVAGAGMPYRARPGERVLLMGQLEAFFAEGRRRFPQADVFRFSYVPWEWAREADLEAAPLAVRGYDTVVFCLANMNSLEVLERLRSFEGRLIVISALSPIYLERVPWVRTALAIYGMGADSFRAGFAALAGDFVPRGELPVELPSLGGE